MAIDPWAPYNQGLANLGQTIQGLGQQDIQRQNQARQNSLADLQMQQSNMEINRAQAGDTALMNATGTGNLSDAMTVQAKKAAETDQAKQATEKRKMVLDTFKQVSDAIKGGTIAPEVGGDFYHNILKMNGVDLDAAGVKMTFKADGGYFSGPITEDALFMINGKPTPYGGKGIIEKAKISGMTPEGKPIFEMTQDTKFSEAKPETIKHVPEGAAIPDGKGGYTIPAPRKEKPLVINNGGGKLTPGYRWTADGNQEAIPGGPADVKAETKRQSVESGKAAIDASVETIDKLLNHPGRVAATGFSSYNPINKIAGTDASDFNKELESFDSKLFLSNIQAMKGMGALSNAEGAKVSAAAGAIKAGMSEKAFVSNMNVIKKALADAKGRMDSGNVIQSRPSAQPQQGGKVRNIGKYAVEVH